MSYELRKILGNRYVMLLLALAVAVNAALFYRRCTKDLGGFTRADIRAEYAHLDTLEQEYDALLNGIYGEDADIMQVLLVILRLWNRSFRGRRRSGHRGTLTRGSAPC